jgi:EAL domain-containing protein (putative c-di-GMP-specific phosphodiesterase class I)
MTSAFQPVRELASARTVAYEGLARSVASQHAGLSLWKLLDGAASDDESIELDRLCRMLHAINFFRQAPDPATDLYLSVHDRLLSAVSSNHGNAFKRILKALELPFDKIVLQLPVASPNQGWLLSYVADNYSRNGFRVALNVTSPAQGREFLARVRPAVIKVDARSVTDGVELPRLLELAHANGAAIVFKHVEASAGIDIARRASEAAAVPVYVQGYLPGVPQATIGEAPGAAAGAPGAGDQFDVFRQGLIT